MNAILIVDDEKNTREGLRLSLEDEFDVYISSNIKGAKDVLDNEHIDVLVTDLRLGAEDGMELIELALKMPQPPISIMMTAYGSVDTAVEAMKRGAYHFVTKPLNIDQLEILIKRALNTRSLKEENSELKKQVQKKFTISNILGKSSAMQPLLGTRLLLIKHLQHEYMLFLLFLKLLLQQLESYNSFLIQRNFYFYGGLRNIWQSRE